MAHVKILPAKDFTDFTAIAVLTSTEVIYVATHKSGEYWAFISGDFGPKNVKVLHEEHWHTRPEIRSID